MLLPKVGMRTVKTAVAAFICMILPLLFTGKLSFYAAIASILCMQQDLPNSIKIGMTRFVGTVLGGIYGFLIILLINNTPIDTHPIIKAAVVSAAIIPLIYLCTVLKQHSAAYITCVVFLSVAIPHSADKIPWLFALTRILETAVGIAVSILVNKILPGRNTGSKSKNKS